MRIVNTIRHGDGTFTVVLQNKEGARFVHTGQARYLVKKLWRVYHIAWY